MEDQRLPTEIATAVTKEVADWQEGQKVLRLWQADSSLWTNHDEGSWTGWLAVPILELSEVTRIEALTQTIKDKGYTDIVLLGMGGSSLCPDLMARTFGQIEGHPKLQILDSTDPAQILTVERSIDLKKTLFIVSSKSGTTLEPNILKDYFYARLQSMFDEQEVGASFMAITDPGTDLEMSAMGQHFREIFYGLPSIGGRYSALSNFGMVPAGLMGIDIRKMLLLAEQMIGACAPANEVRENLGAYLGIILGVCANAGKDKITLVTSPEIKYLGAWLEQLLAESTGKNGKGLIPIDQEPLGPPEVYSDDRVFVYIRSVNHPDSFQDDALAAIEQSGQVVLRLRIIDKEHLGAEFFRWEIATAVAGSIIGINPFDQPNVEGSKVRTLELTSEYEQTKKIPKPDLLFAGDDIELLTDERNTTAINHRLKGEKTVANYLMAHLNRVETHDYVNISAFIENSEEHFELLEQIRVVIRDRKKVATCLGFGPRFLHSTGQVYKGGPNTGVFLQITADYPEDIPVPGHQYTFGTVIAAQAQADFEVLSRLSRRILQIHLGQDIARNLHHLLEIIKVATV